MTTIRVATVEDAPRIAAIKVVGWQAAYRGMMPDTVLNAMSVAEHSARFKDRMAANPGRVLLAEADNMATGYVSMGPTRDWDLVDPATGEIYALYVHPDHSRTGLGSALMTAALDTLRRDGFSQVTLWVLADNVPAIRFYQTHGFEPDGRSKLETWGDATVAEISMARVL